MKNSGSSLAEEFFWVFMICSACGVVLEGARRGMISSWSDVTLAMGGKGS